LLPFSPTVNRIREEVQTLINHPINHVLIQHYRHGGDYISEHSDKTLDIARGSKIVNVSLGAQRTMVLRAKKDLPQAPHAEEKPEANSREGPILRRDMQRIPMPHNSMFVLGLETNQKWLHAIRQDKRAPNIKSPVELAYNGERISLTFRHIATYLSHDEGSIYGQGAQAKSSETARPVINGESDPTEKLLEAFGAENQKSNFNWDAYYGRGFDVLHFQVPKPKILTSGVMDVATARITICLWEKEIDFSTQVILPEQLASFRTYTPRGTTPVFMDSDRERTTMSDSLATIQYLEMYYTPSQSEGPWLLPSLSEERAKYALALNRLQESDGLLDISVRGSKENLASELKIWDSYLQQSEFLVGGEFSLVDIAVYPILRKLRESGQALPEGLTAYTQMLSARSSIRRTYGEDEEQKSQSERSLEATVGSEDGIEELGQALKTVSLKECSGPQD
jgi:glutathione S-transferase